MKIQTRMGRDVFPPRKLVSLKQSSSKKHPAPWGFQTCPSLFLLIAVLYYPTTISAQVVVTEIMYDAPGSDTGKEWIELFNSGATPIDIKSWKINDGSNHVFNVPPKNGSVGSTVVAPSGYVVLAADAAAFKTQYPNVTNVIDTTLALTNSSGIISLLNASSTIQETVSYDSSVGAAGDGNTLNRISVGVLSPRRPSPGVILALDAIPPSAPKVVEPKAPKVSKKSALVVSDSPERIVSTSDDVVQDVPADIPSEMREPASDILGAGSMGGGGLSTTWWWIGAGLLTLVGAGAMMMSRVAQKKEWDIIEEKG